MTRPLVALDVDGTLLTSQQTVSSRTRAVLGRAEAAGWHVVVVTGRPLVVAWPVVHDLALGAWVVAANGATVAEIASGRVVHQASLAGGAAAGAMARARAAVPDLRWAVTTERGFEREPGFEQVAPLSEGQGTRVADATPDEGDVVTSVVGFVPDADARDLVDAIAPVVPDGVVVAPSGLPGTIELTPPGVHKGSGLEHLCQRLGVERRNVVAFGDGLNDHELLRFAGLGVAMANADAATRAVADEVTAMNDDDGIALVLERLLR